VVLASSQLVAASDQRVSLGVLGPKGAPLPGASLHIVVLDLTSQPQKQLFNGYARYMGQGLEGKGVYVMHTTFPHAGTFAGDVSVTADGSTAHTTVPLPVLATDPTPAVGSAAPQSHNPTASDVSDISLIDSGRPPNDMHYISIAAAIAAHHPLVVYFGSPGFCTSATCAPELHVVQALEATFRPQGVDFVHIETYRNGNPGPNRETSATFDEWHLSSDPWVFVIGRDGIITAKFDGPATAAEMQPSIQRALASVPLP
jgi:hypothetical protein